MENRDRDKMSRSEQPTDAGKVNRETSKKESNSNVEYGENIGRSENVENDSTRRDEGQSRGLSSNRSEH
jgi:hypothetical protein